MEHEFFPRGIVRRNTPNNQNLQSSSAFRLFDLRLKNSPTPLLGTHRSEMRDNKNKPSGPLSDQRMLNYWYLRRTCKVVIP